MAVPNWYIDNDNIVYQRRVRSSTMASTAYLTSSTNLTLELWTGGTSSTANLILIGGSSNVTMSYTTATTDGANGTYQYVLGTTQTTGLSTGGSLWTRVRVNHSGLDAVFKRHHLIARRAST